MNYLELNQQAKALSDSAAPFVAVILLFGHEHDPQQMTLTTNATRQAVLAALQYGLLSVEENDIHDVHCDPNTDSERRASWMKGGD